MINEREEEKCKMEDGTSLPFFRAFVDSIDDFQEVKSLGYFLVGETSTSERRRNFRRQTGTSPSYKERDEKYDFDIRAGSEFEFVKPLAIAKIARKRISEYENGIFSEFLGLED